MTGQMKTGVYSRPIRESLAGARPPVNVDPRRLPLQSKSFDRWRTIMALKITERDVDGVTVLEMEGRIVLGEETVGLREKVKSLLGMGKKKLVLDLKGITMIDSSGLGALVSVHSSAKSGGATLRL